MIYPPQTTHENLESSTSRFPTSQNSAQTDEEIFDNFTKEPTNTVKVKLDALDVTLKEDALAARFDRRNAILQKGCQYYLELSNMAKNGTIDEMLKMHDKIYNLDLPDRPNATVRYDKHGPYSHLREITDKLTKRKINDFVSCLPAKSGCSNYLMAFATLKLQEGIQRSTIFI